MAPPNDLKAQVESLQETVSAQQDRINKLEPDTGGVSRRGVLAGLAGVAGLGAAIPYMSQPAAAQAVGQLGDASNRVDVFAETVDANALEAAKHSNAKIASGTWSDVKSTIEGANSNDTVLVYPSADTRYTVDATIDLPDIDRLTVKFMGPVLNVEIDTPAFNIYQSKRVTFEGSLVMRHFSSETGTLFRISNNAEFINANGLSITTFAPKGSVYKIKKTTESGTTYIGTGPILSYKSEEDIVRAYSDPSLSQQSMTLDIGQIIAGGDLDISTGKIVSVENVEDVIVRGVFGEAGENAIHINGSCRAVDVEFCSVTGWGGASVKVDGNASGRPENVTFKTMSAVLGGTHNLYLECDSFYGYNLRLLGADETDLYIEEGNDIHLLGGEVRNSNQEEVSNAYNIHISDGSSKNVSVKNMYLNNNGKVDALIRWGDGSRGDGTFRNCRLINTGGDLVENLPSESREIVGLDLETRDKIVDIPVDSTGEFTETVNLDIDFDAGYEDVDHSDIQTLDDFSTGLSNIFFQPKGDGTAILYYTVDQAGSDGSTMEYRYIIRQNSPVIGTL